jgi:hypothetical protein
MEVSGQLDDSAALLPGITTTATMDGGWVGPTASLDDVKK